MYWGHVARKDFSDAVRSRMFWGLSGAMLLLATVGMYIPEAIGDDPTVSDGITILSGVIGLFIPLVALVVGYMSIVGERETGSIRMVLSLPLKRWEVMLGKFVGRTAVVAIPILLGFALAVPFALVVYGDLPGTDYAQFVTGVVLIAVTFVAIALGISGSVASRGKALAGVVGVVVLFEFLWNFLVLGLYWLLNRELPEGAGPTWVEVLSQAPPTQAALTVSDGLWNGISTSEPLVLQEWFSGLILLAWMAVPLLIGYLLFDRADIS